MDFADAPEDAQFRAEFRQWLERNLPEELKVEDAQDQRISPDRDILEKTHRLAEKDARCRLGRHRLAQAIRRARCQLYAAGDLR